MVVSAGMAEVGLGMGVAGDVGVLTGDGRLPVTVRLIASEGVIGIEMGAGVSVGGGAAVRVRVGSVPTSADVWARIRRATASSPRTAAMSNRLTVDLNNRFDLKRILSRG